jgi:presenilin 1
MAAEESEEAPHTFDIVSERIIQVVLPVTICALYCCIIIRILSLNLLNSEINLIDSTWQHLGIQIAGDVVAGTGVSTSVSDSLIIVSIFSILIILITLLILFIFYMKWQQCLIYYFYLPSVVILAIVTPAFFRTVLSSLNWFSIDIFSVLLSVWNFTALGIMSIFSLYAPTPLCLRQFYLIHNSAIISVLIIHALPGWAPWLLLTFLVLWDLFAVLAPFGPLNLIINLAEKEGIVDMPGLIYSTDLEPAETNREEGENATKTVSQQEGQPLNAAKSKVKTTKTIKSDDSIENTQSVRDSDLKSPVTDTVSPAPKSRRYRANIVEKGVHIGLGDFIFYSLLIGLTSKGRNQNDFYTVLTTLNAVQFGLVVTLFILALTKRALPALPISIGLGLSVAALTIQFVPQFSNHLASAAIFV